MKFSALLAMDDEGFKKSFCHLPADWWTEVRLGAARRFIGIIAQNATPETLERVEATFAKGVRCSGVLKLYNRSAYLYRTQGAGNRRTMTFRFRLRRNIVGGAVTVTCDKVGEVFGFPFIDAVYIDSATPETDVILNGGSDGAVMSTFDYDMSKLTDVTVWIDTTRQQVRMWFDGVEDKNLNVIVPITQNYQTIWGEAGRSEEIINPWEGAPMTPLSPHDDPLYMGEFLKVDGGLVLPGVAVTDYGADGYHLRFDAIGRDSSGNANHFSNEGFAVSDLVFP